MLRGILTVMFAGMGMALGILMFFSAPLLGSLVWFVFCVLVLVIGLQEFFTALGRKLDGENQQQDDSNPVERSG